MNTLPSVLTFLATVVLVVSIGLAILINWRSTKVRQQRRAAEEIRRAGGT